MTREEIIRMALEAGMSFNQSLEELNTPFCDGVHCEEFERFAKLVAAAEREACAKVAAEPQVWAMPSFNRAPSDRTIGRIEGGKEMSYRIASAIRARGQA